MIDASAFIALFDKSDQFHQEAIAFRDSFILTYRVSLFTTNYIYSEVMSHLTHLSYDLLRDIEQLIHPDSGGTTLRIQELWVERDTVDRAVPVYFAYKDNDFSISDCTAFILMQENRISAAFSFDEDYKVYVYRQGYAKKSFWILPEMLESYLSLSEPKVRLR